MPRPARLTMIPTSIAVPAAAHQALTEAAAQRGVTRSRLILEASLREIGREDLIATLREVGRPKDQSPKRRAKRRT